MELEPEPELFLSRNWNRHHKTFSKVGTGTITFHKSEPEPKKIVMVPQHWYVRNTGVCLGPSCSSITWIQLRVTAQDSASGPVQAGKHFSSHRLHFDRFRNFCTDPESRSGALSGYVIKCVCTYPRIRIRIKMSRIRNTIVETKLFLSISVVDEKI
jgi:hypothetical protein